MRQLSKWPVPIEPVWRQQRRYMLAVSISLAAATAVAAAAAAAVAAAAAAALALAAAAAALAHAAAAALAHAAALALATATVATATVAAATLVDIGRRLHRREPRVRDVHSARRSRSTVSVLCFAVYSKVQAKLSGADILSTLLAGGDALTDIAFTMQRLSIMHTTADHVVAALLLLFVLLPTLPRAPAKCGWCFARRSWTQSA